MKFKFIAIAKVVKKHDLMIMAAEHNGTAITGQHIDPLDTTTEGNLTLKQMKGEVPLNAEQRKKFPFVINPDKMYAIKAGREFDTDSAEDMAIANLAILQNKIAKNKTSFNRQTHAGYFENRELDAQEETQSVDLYFEALSKVRGCTEDELINVAMLLDYLVPDVTIDVKRTSLTIIKQIVYRLAKDNSKEVIECFAESSKEKMYILKLVKENIINKKEDGFYDGTRYLGSNIQAVIDFMGKKESDAAVSRWKSLLMQAEGKVSHSKSAEEEVKELVRDAKSDYVDKNYDTAIEKLTKAYKMQPSEEILRLKTEIISVRTENNIVPFDINNLTADQQKLLNQLKELQGADLVTFATTKKVGKKADLEKMDENDLRVLILKTLTHA